MPEFSRIRFPGNREKEIQALLPVFFGSGPSAGMVEWRERPEEGRNGYANRLP